MAPKPALGRGRCLLFRRVLRDRRNADNGAGVKFPMTGGRYSAAMQKLAWPSISERHLASLSPSGSTKAAVRALAMASAARLRGIWPASAGRMRRASMLRRLGDQAEPGLDLRLFLFEAMAVRAKPAQFGQHKEAQIAANRGGIDLHAEIDTAEPAFTLADGQEGPRQERRQ